MRIQSKPIIGSTIRCAETGEVFGRVLNFNVGDNICNVLKPDGGISCFIWRFKDCLNNKFNWDGKNDNT